MLRFLYEIITFICKTLANFTPVEYAHIEHHIYYAVLYLIVPSALSFIVTWWSWKALVGAWLLWISILLASTLGTVSLAIFLAMFFTPLAVPILAIIVRICIWIRKPKKAAVRTTAVLIGACFIFLAISWQRTLIDQQAQDKLKYHFHLPKDIIFLDFERSQSADSFLGVVQFNDFQWQIYLNSLDASKTAIPHLLHQKNQLNDPEGIASKLKWRDLPSQSELSYVWATSSSHSNIRKKAQEITFGKIICIGYNNLESPKHVDFMNATNGVFTVSDCAKKSNRSRSDARLLGIIDTEKKQIFMEINNADLDRNSSLHGIFRKPAQQP